jgi:hypothetical protein
MADTLDGLSGKAFDDLYASEIEPELKRREAARQQAIQALALFLLAGVLAVVIESFVAHSLTNGELNYAPPGFVLITLFGAAFIGYLPIQKVSRGAKADIITSLCKPLGLTYQAKDFIPTDFRKFLDLRLLPRPDSWTFVDHFAGDRRGRPFELYEATLIQGSGKNRRTAFHGQLLRIAFPRPFDGVTVVLRDGGLLSRFECPPEMARVALEDPKFEEIFEAYGTDQVESRVILTPAVMQELLSLETAFAGERLRFAFVDGDVLIAMEGHTRFEIGNMFTTLVDRRRVETVARDLAAVYRLIDSLEG